MMMLRYHIHNMAQRLQSWRKACRATRQIEADLRRAGFVKVADPKSPLIISEWVKPL